jgi:hypothetical protein
MIQADCILWTGALTNGGYGQLTIGGKHKSAHCHAWEQAFGPIPDGLWILHKCDVPNCINPEHLFLGTGTDNQNDCVNKGRKNILKGEKCPWTKLSESDVAFIRSAPLTQRELAKIFDVSNSHICHIRTYKDWRHIS